MRENVGVVEEKKICPQVEETIGLILFRLTAHSASDYRLPA